MLWGVMAAITAQQAFASQNPTTALPGKAGKAAASAPINSTTPDAAYASYYNSVRIAIEQKGTKNFPKAGGKSLYGKLALVLTIDSNGKVLSAEVVESSGNRNLDRYSKKIARTAGPFAPFNQQMRSRADQVMMVFHFNYANDDEPVETKPGKP